MEINSSNNPNSIDLNVSQFKKDYFKYLSIYFNNIFSDYIKKITIIKKNKANGMIIFDVEIDEKCSNPLKIAHGGALATLMENLATVSLYYFTNQKYKTLDISVNYKNQVELNKPFQVYVKCEKIGFTTSFLEVELKKEDEVCTQASIIKSKMDAKF
jgi:acyl-coenzyme A thioesterase PaaI-like protein